MEIGAFEILAVAAIALLFFGPSKLPGLGKSVGEAIRGFKKGMSDMQDSLNDDGKPTNKNVNPTANQQPKREPAAPAASNPLARDDSSASADTAPDQKIAEDILKEPAGKPIK